MARGQERLKEALEEVARLTQEKRAMETEMARKSRVLARAKSFLQQYVEASGGTSPAGRAAERAAEAAAEAMSTPRTDIEG